MYKFKSLFIERKNYLIINVLRHLHEKWYNFAFYKICRWMKKQPLF